VFEHVRRELNRDADALANEAMDAAAKDTAALKAHTS
jgi:ribonuclease HI